MVKWVDGCSFGSSRTSLKSGSVLAAIRNRPPTVFFRPTNYPLPSTSHISTTNLTFFPPSGKLLPTCLTLFMSQICAVTGKKPNVANNVSHANNKTKRRQMPNLQKVSITNPATGKQERIMVSGRGLRTLKKWKAEGRAIDFKALTA
jgi:large subunit ribosomal protein L28